MGLYSDISATLVVRTLTDTVVELMHDGINVEPLEDQHFMDIFKHLSANAFGKEAVPAILKFLAEKPEMSVGKAIEEIGLSVNMAEVEQLIEVIVNARRDFIQAKGARAVGPLMGVVMNELRGKVDGKVINRMVADKVKEVLKEG
jgi:glutamyl-tRNA(Gln) amidotransferase subunit E